MDKNCQTWLTIVNNGQPKSTKVNHSEGYAQPWSTIANDTKPKSTKVEQT
jgi:hypothetical protein